MTTATPKTKTTWKRLFEMPTNITPIRPSCVRLLYKTQARETVSTGPSTLAATGHSTTVEAWPVTVYESRMSTTPVDGCFRSTGRYVRCGWVIRATTNSRWEGESVPTVEIEYHPGRDCPSLSRMIDTRFGDAVESDEPTSPVIEGAVIYAATCRI